MHDARADAAILCGKDALELRNDRLRLGVLKRQDRHRLVAHPVGVERQRRLDRGLAVGAVAENDQKIPGGFRADHARTRPEPVDQVDQRLRRDIAQRQDRNAVAGAGVTDIRPARHGRRLEHDAVDVAALHQRCAVRLEHDLQHRDEVVLGQRPRRRDRDAAGDRGLDRVVQLQGVAEHRLHDFADIGVLEIQADIARLEGRGRCAGVATAFRGAQKYEPLRRRSATRRDQLRRQTRSRASAALRGRR